MAETDHIKNIENFAVMISACNGFGSGYNPNNSGLTGSALKTALTERSAGTTALRTV